MGNEAKPPPFPPLPWGREDGATGYGWLPSDIDHPLPQALAANPAATIATQLHRSEKAASRARSHESGASNEHPTHSPLASDNANTHIKAHASNSTKYQNYERTLTASVPKPRTYDNHELTRTVNIPAVRICDPYNLHKHRTSTNTRPP